MTANTNKPDRASQPSLTPTTIEGLRHESTTTSTIRKDFRDAIEKECPRPVRFSGQSATQFRPVHVIRPRGDYW